MNIRRLRSTPRDRTTLLRRLPSLTAALFLLISGCGDGPSAPDSSVLLSGRWEGTFQVPSRVVAIQLDIDPIGHGPIEGTGRLGYTGLGVVLPVTGNYDRPLLQIILMGPDSTTFTMVGERSGNTIVGTALSTFSAPGIPPGVGTVTLNHRPDANTGGAP